MSVQEKILRHQLDHGVFDGEENKVSGIAKFSIDNGYHSLSSAQRNVIDRFLTQRCSGCTDPGGNHNECNQELSEEALLEAYKLSDDAENLQCESCRSESGFHAHQWDRIERE
jgi:hypothetical protein